MAEIKEKVTPVRVDYVCDECKIGRMRPTGEILTSFPSQHPHRCNNEECGAEKTFTSISYPHILYEGPTKTGVVPEVLGAVEEPKEV